MFAASDKNSIGIYNSQTGELVRQINQVGIISFMFLGSESKIVTTSLDGKLKIWDDYTCECLKEIQLNLRDIGGSLTISPDCRKCIVSDKFRESVIVNLETDEQTTLPNSQATVCASFNSIGDKLIYSYGNGDNLIDLIDFNTFRPIHRFYHSGYFVSSIGFSPDNSKIVTCGTDGVCKIWNSNTFVQIFSFSDTKSLTSFSFSPDCSTIAVSSIKSSFDDEDFSKVKIFDLTTCEEIMEIVDISTIHSIKFDPTGTKILFSTNNGYVKLFNLEETQDCIFVRRVGRNPVLILNFNLNHYIMD